MVEQLEEKVNVSENKTLGQELKQSIVNYPKTWREYGRNLAPAIIASSIGSALGQWAVTKLGYDGKAATTAAAYVCGYIPGYITFFGTEFIRNRHRYPKLLSKEFGEFVGTFLAADYVADLSTFTPSFIAANLWLTDNTDLHPAVRGLAAWWTASLFYISSISALHPLARRINSSINNGIKKVYRKIRKKPSI
jgi:hypothetical protein